MSNSNPISTPLEARICYSRVQSIHLTQDKVVAMKDVPYKQVLGTLHYLITCT